MRRLVCITVAIGLAAGKLLAETPISPDDLLDRLVGGSAVFTESTTGAQVGIEYFPTRRRSFWTESNGRCTIGDLSVEDDALCFRYRDDPSVAHCWRPFTDEGRLGYRSVRTDEVQWIDPDPGLPLTCTDGLLS